MAFDSFAKCVSTVSIIKTFFSAFAELFPTPDVHSTMSDILVTNTRNAAATRSTVLTSSQSCHINLTFGMSSTSLSHDDVMIKNTSQELLATDDYNNELFLWKIDLFDDNVSDESNQTPTNHLHVRDPLHNAEIVRYWGSCIRHVSAISEIAYNLRRNVTKQEDPESTLDTSTIVFVLGALGTGVFIYGRFCR